MNTTAPRPRTPEVDDYSSSSVEESLVADPRAELTPSQMVERKLVNLLKSNPLPVSQLHSGRLLNRSR
jgi:hypothetical protein